MLLSELVREMLPGSRIKQGQNLLSLNCCPFAADVALQGLPHLGLHSHLCPLPPLQRQASTPTRRPAQRVLCAGLVVLKSSCNLYYCFPRSDGVFWRNVCYLRCSARWVFCHRRCSVKQNGKQAHSFNRVLLLLSLTNQPLMAAGICWGRSSKVGIAEPRSSPSGSPWGAVHFPFLGIMPSSPSLLPPPKGDSSCTSLCISSH